MALKFLAIFIFSISLSLQAAFKDCTELTEGCFSNDNNPEKSFLMKGTNGKAIVLFHGLTDSPYFLKDIALEYFKNGYTVYAPLLSGHGTVPEDLHNVKYMDWIEDAIRTLKVAQTDGFSSFTVGGFSMGGLIAAYLSQQPDWSQSIDSLVLYGPAFQIKSRLGRSICKNNPDFKTWAKNKEGSSRIKYQRMSFHAVCELTKLSDIVKSKPIMHPTFLALTEYDRTIDSEFALEFMENFDLTDKIAIVFSKKEKEPSLFAQFIRSKEMAHTDLIFKQNTSGFNPHFDLMADKMLQFLLRLH